MITYPRQARQHRPNRRQGSTNFQGFSRGMNSSVPSNLLSDRELASCTNFKINKGGQLETRPAISALMSANTNTDTITAMETVTIEYSNGTGAEYQFFVTDADELWYNNSGTAAEVDAAQTYPLAGAPYIFEYNGVLLICDGGYLKYLTQRDAPYLKPRLCYDAGDTGAMYDNSTGTDNASFTVAAAGEEVCARFTTPTWDTGYEIPFTSFSMMLSSATDQVGITIYVRNSSGTALTQVDLDTTVESTAKMHTIVRFDWPSLLGSAHYDPNTDYYICAEDDGSGNLTLHCDDTNTVVSGKWWAYDYDGATFTAKTQDWYPIVKAGPGLPPKASFGCVSNNRPFVAGDPDNAGYVWYGNLSHLDWSTADGGGYIGVVDDTRSGFEVGAMQDLYGSLYIFGTESSPYLCKLLGSSPSDYSLPLAYQEVWSTQKTLLSTMNDLWYGSGDGVNHIRGVDETGDLRTAPISESVDDRINDYWLTTTAFAGYYPTDGQYWLCLPAHSKILVAHTSLPYATQEGMRFPWVEYDFHFPSSADPTAFGMMGDDFCIGCDDGNIYKIDTSKYRDLGTTQIQPSLKTPYIEIPFTHIDVNELQLYGYCEHGADVDISIYKDGQESTVVKTWADFELPASDTQSGTPEQKVLWLDLNITGRSVQVELSNIDSSGSNVFINGILLKYRYLEK